MPTFRGLAHAIAASLVIAAIACGGPPADGITQPPPGDTAIAITRGSTIGRDVYVPGDSPAGGQGVTIAGIDCIDSDGLFHIHSHVTLFVNGEQIAIPAGIGVVPPQLTAGYALFNPSSCFYWLHTHDATGVIHINPARNVAMTLGRLFDVWGYTLSRTEVAGNLGPVVVYVNGSVYGDDIREIRFADQMEISLQVGLPNRVPPVYRIPANP